MRRLLSKLMRGNRWQSYLKVEIRRATSYRRNASIMGKGWIMIALCVSSFCFSEAQRPTVKLSSVPDITVKGIVQKTRKGRDVDSFIGIPYAEPPIGDLRFRDPKPKMYSNGTLLADKQPQRCLQSIRRMIGHPFSPRDLKGDEDCLYLNVHRPAVAGSPSLPVMVYFQAADLIPGTDDISNIGPEFLLDKDIILVTLTYRLGILGFLSTGDEAAPGNFGLKDQKLALEWVKSNIAGFGGDPNRVTLFGQGEAARNIHLHALVNHTADLFHQYILESGTAFAYWSMVDPKTCMEWTQVLAGLNGCPTDSSSVIAECLRKADSRELLNSASRPDYPVPAYKYWGPTKEPISPGAFLTECPEDLIARGEQRDLPFIAGVTQYDNTYFLGDLDRSWYYSTSLTVAEQVCRKIFKSPDTCDVVLYFYFENYYDSKLNPALGDKASRFLYWEPIGASLNDMTHFYPQVKMLEERRQNSTRPFYFYSFEYKGSFRMGDWHPEWYGLGEASHGDDLLYLFEHDTSKFPKAKGRTRNGGDHQVVDTMVELWTSFATEGVPSSSQAASWTAYDSEGYYLKIGLGESPTTAMGSQFLSKRMKFWAELSPPDCGIMKD